MRSAARTIGDMDTRKNGSTPEKQPSSEAVAVVPHGEEVNVQTGQGAHPPAADVVSFYSTRRGAGRRRRDLKLLVGRRRNG